MKMQPTANEIFCGWKLLINRLLSWISISCRRFVDYWRMRVRTLLNKFNVQRLFIKLQNLKRDVLGFTRKDKVYWGSEFCRRFWKIDFSTVEKFFLHSIWQSRQQFIIDRANTKNIASFIDCIHYSFISFFK